MYRTLMERIDCLINNEEEIKTYSRPEDMDEAIRVLIGLRLRYKMLQEKYDKLEEENDTLINKFLEPLWKEVKRVIKKEYDDKRRNGVMTPP